MFKRNSEEPVLLPTKNLREAGSGHLNKLRILQSISLRKLNDSESNHSSVMGSSMHNSIKNIGNVSMTSSQFSIRSSLVRSQPKEARLGKSEGIEQLLQKNYGRAFTKSLVLFLNKDWNNQQRNYLAEKELQKFFQLVVQRSNWMKDLVDEFLDREYEVMSGEERRTMTGILFKEAVKALKDIEGIVPDLIRKIPEEKLLKQETTIEELSRKLLQIYDPKFAYSNSKMKERMSLYLQEFVGKRNNLKSEICTRLKGNLQFLEEVERYFGVYQKEILRLKAQLAATQIEKAKLQELLSRKSSFTPVQVDYDRMYEMKEKANQQIRQDLKVNVIQFHEEKHRKNEGLILKMEEENMNLKEEIDELKQETATLKDQVLDWKKNVPQLVETGTQVFLIAQSKGSEGHASGSGSAMGQFLENVVTPFSFSLQITGSLINILSIDKLLFDYELIRHRLGLRSFEQFLFEWFIVRTGCKKVAQIFAKNFLYSLKELKVAHKRFSIFYRVCGFSGFRGRNMQQDLQGVFFTSHLCWYYLMRLALMYRKKLSDNPTGYHLLPPLSCEEIFKLPLRKIYELVEQFFRSEEIEVPEDLTQKIDHYCINEISKFKGKTESFQKETLEEIHILREINFDFTAGFVLEYVANLRCSNVQKLLRTVHNQQQQAGYILGYSEFEAVYRKFYRQRRAKIEQIYAKLCLVNQHDMLNVENMRVVVLAILEDETPLRSCFQRLQSLKMLVLSEKTVIQKNEKKAGNSNSYQNFRERFYHEFYDFYNTTSFLQDIFKIVKGLIRKRLKEASKSEAQIQNLVEYVPEKQIEVKKEEDNDDESQSRSQDEKIVAVQVKPKQSEENKDPLVNRLDEWGKIMQRIPHFASKVLTIEQIVIHSIRRKEMIEATQYAWRTLREILTILGNS